MGEPNPSETDVERFRADLDGNFRGPLISYFLRRVGDRSEAEDLTQEVFVRILNQSQGLDPNFARAYVFTAAGNLLRDRARRAVSRHTNTHTSVDLAVRQGVSQLREEISPERVVVGRETLRDILLALDGLAVTTRDIFVLYRIEKMKQHEIATLLGLSQSAIEKHLVKAMGFLKERFGQP